MKRVFIAISLSDEIRQIFAKVQERVSKANKNKRVTWVKPEVAHVNLHFIGDLAEERVEQVIEVLNQITDFYPAPELTMTGVGGFPSIDNPRVLFVGIRDLRQDNLVKLHKFVSDEMVKLGIGADTKPYMAHLTLGRLKEHRSKITIPDVDFEGASWLVDSVNFIESELSEEGPVYRVIKSFKLKS